MSQAADVSRSFEAVLVRQCAPTLAGMKPGSIFCFQHPVPELSRQKVRQLNERLAPLGLTIRTLLEHPAPGSAIVYVYRRNHLNRLLSDYAHREFLRSIGYTGSDLDDLLAQLAF